MAVWFATRLILSILYLPGEIFQIIIPLQKAAWKSSVWII